MYKIIQMKDNKGPVYPISNVYSTREQKIGIWIDGKPLYRKVIVFPDGLGGATGEHGKTYSLRDFDINNVEEIFIGDPSFYTLSINRYPFAYYDGSYYDIYVNENYLGFRITYDPIAKSRMVVTLEYTKTTD